jgi:prepilin-type N-terminal cleavage/methylation domain-containing protein
MSVRCPFNKSGYSGRGCRGFTLVELLVALFIGSIVMVGASQVLQQLLVMVPNAEASMLAMRQAQFAGNWIVRDAYSAQTITPVVDPEYSSMSLVMYHEEWNSESTTITYFVDDNRNLLRRLVVENQGGIDSSETQVANSITSITSLYTEPMGKDRKMLTVTIIATVGSASESRTYQTEPRSY